MQPESAVILLAAGSSSRLGRPKQLLTHDGQTFLRRAAETALGSSDRVLVVLGAEEENCRIALAGLPVTIVDHPGWREGLASTIRLGVQQGLRLWPDLSGAVVAAVDQPFMTGELLSRLIAAGEAHASGVAASRYAGTLGIPAWFARRRFDTLAALEGDRGAKAFIESLPVAEIDFPRGEIDIDTVDDYDRLVSGPC